MHSATPATTNGERESCHLHRVVYFDREPEGGFEVVIIIIIFFRGGGLFVSENLPAEREVRLNYFRVTTTETRR